MGDRSVGDPASQILIQAGIPGKPGFTVDNGEPYPNTTSDMVKALAELGFTVTYEHERAQRRYVSLNAAEFWIPIITVASSILTAVSGNLFSEAIIRITGREKERDDILHVEYRIVRQSGKIQSFRADGKASDVLKAIDRFEDDERGK